MTHQVSLRGAAYEALRREKRPGESFSDVVLRIIQEARPRAKDPWSFLAGPPLDPRGMERRLQEIEGWRDADRLPEES